MSSSDKSTIQPFSSSWEQSDATTATLCPHTYSSIVQNFRLIWLLPNIKTGRDEFRHSISQLQNIVNIINTFDDVDQCIDFITEIKYEKTFLIVPDVLGRSMMPLIHSIFQLHSIYVLKEEQSASDEWQQNWSKVKGVFTQISLIHNLLEQDARDCDRNSVSINVMAPSSESEPTLDEIEQSFMYTQILKEILLAIEYNQKSVENFGVYCRDSNYGKLESIDSFVREYRHRSPIWWYSYSTFIYPIINRALRTLEVETLMKMGFFLRDLHCQIKQLHLEQSGDQRLRLFTVYRGQGMPHIEFEKMKRNRGGLLSFNNFLSTSRDREVSFAFADSNRDNPDMTGILFQIKVDATIASASFALIDNVSCFEDVEQEVLFSMHTIFRIGEMKQLEYGQRFWQVELTLTSDTDPQIKSLTDYFRMETYGYNEWYRLGRILSILKECEKAEHLFKTLLCQESSDMEQMHVYNQLGTLKLAQDEYSHAIAFFERSLEIGQRIFSHDDPYLIDFLCNYGSACIGIADYSKALLFLKRALEVGEKTLPLNHYNLALPNGQLGVVYTHMSQYATALFYYQKALEICEKTLPSIHPYVSIAYNCIGSLYREMGEYRNALLYLKKSVGITAKVTPPNSSALAICYCNIALLHENMSEYSDALSFYEKGLAILQQTVSPHYPEAAIFYNNMGVLYSKVGEFPKALLHHQKSLEICEKILPGHHLDLARSYSNIGVVHEKMDENNKALSYYQKSLLIREKVLPPDHLDLAVTYNNIGLLYLKIQKHSEALSYLEESLKMKQRTLPPNHPSLANSFNNIGRIYSSNNEYAKALSYYERAVEIRQKILPANHADFSDTYCNLGCLYRKMGDYLKALSFFHQSLDIDKRNLSLNHPYLAHSYAQIATLYYRMNDHSRAFTFMQRAIELGQNSLSPNDDRMYEWRRLMKLIKNESSFHSDAMLDLLLLGAIEDDGSDNNNENGK